MRKRRPINRDISRVRLVSSSSINRINHLEIKKEVLLSSQKIIPLRKPLQSAKAV